MHERHRPNEAFIKIFFKYAFATYKECIIIHIHLHTCINFCIHIYIYMQLDSFYHRYVKTKCADDVKIVQTKRLPFTGSTKLTNMIMH